MAQASFLMVSDPNYGFTRQSADVGQAMDTANSVVQTCNFLASLNQHESPNQWDRDMKNFMMFDV